LTYGTNLKHDILRDRGNEHKQDSNPGRPLLCQPQHDLAAAAAAVNEAQGEPQQGQV